MSSNNSNTNFNIGVEFTEIANYDHGDEPDSGYETDTDFESGNVYSEEELISSLL